MHADLLKLLLPPSSIDPNGPAIGAELSAEGSALDIAQWAADQILVEMDPRTTSALLADWERVYGLSLETSLVLTPYLDANFVLDSSVLVSLADASTFTVTTVPSPLSFQERRTALVAKVTLQGGQTPAFFIALAAALGYAITITEWRPYSTELDTEYGVTDEPWQFVWQVNAALSTLRESTSEDDTEMATAIWGNDLLESMITRYKPAHTHVLFSYV